MVDIAIVYAGPTPQGDWSVAGGGLAIDGGGLASDVGVSLFTDARAPDDVVLASGSTDRRGCWIDTYQEFSVGSLLWLLARAKKTGSTGLLIQAQNTCQAALQHLLDAGVAVSITVAARWITPTSMGINIAITEPSGNTSSFAYAWAWNGIG